jgi:CheY-like chemotaxis protein
MTKKVQGSSNRKDLKQRVVLLVEDEAIVREVTARVLESGGYRVLESSGPREALRIAGTYGEPIDMLLTDVVMPEMNGIDLAGQIRKLQPCVATIFMSGYADGHVLKNTLLSHARHIQKPFTINFLLAQIADALNAATGDEAKVSATAVAAIDAIPRVVAKEPFASCPNPAIDSVRDRWVPE